MDVYTESPKTKSVCKLCGDSKTYTHKGKGKSKNKKYPTPYYFKAFVKEGWFRGDDSYLGRICLGCIRKGRTEEMLGAQ
jgi:hypothetical protein